MVSEAGACSAGDCGCGKASPADGLPQASAQTRMVARFLSYARTDTPGYLFPLRREIFCEAEA